MAKSFIALGFLAALAGCATTQRPQSAQAAETKTVKDCKMVDRDDLGSRIATRQVCTDAPAANTTDEAPKL
jgi:hypothetical protein